MESSNLPEGDPEQKPFDPEVLDRTVIAVPLLRMLKKRPNDTYDVIIDLNLDYREGSATARTRVESLLAKVVRDLKLDPKVPRLDTRKSAITDQYLFGTLEGEVIREMVRRDSEGRKRDRPVANKERTIYRIWPDFEVQPLITKSISTVKADAARNSFAAFGENIVWAVMDSGINGDHPHFKKNGNLLLDPPLEHQDFTVPDGTAKGALTDDYGHGTHVAGILAGEYGPGNDSSSRSRNRQKPVYAAARHRDEEGNVTVDSFEIKNISGMAPRCRLLSLKVLDSGGQSAPNKAFGKASNLIAGVAYIQKMNENGRQLRIHGLNMSVGYDFQPEWFACGQSPLCVEVNRLVKSGVVVVVAAGNTGYGFSATKFKGTVASGIDLTINDPGNAEFAITVGSTHREMPHIFGVSYFSSKGPTGDGRRKPDLVAPGEKIISCAAKRQLEAVESRLDPAKDYQYVEDSGTSMAAPHVSGVIAAFLSIRREFIGQAERVKEIFMSTATDLKRDPYFQGSGLVDLMRAIQSV
jgi:serine protease AprX